MPEPTPLRSRREGGIARPRSVRPARTGRRFDPLTSLFLGTAFLIAGAVVLLVPGIPLLLGGAFGGACILLSAGWYAASLGFGIFSRAPGRTSDPPAPVGPRPREVLAPAPRAPRPVLPPRAARRPERVERPRPVARPMPVPRAVVAHAGPFPDPPVLLRKDLPPTPVPRPTITMARAAPPAGLYEPPEEAEYSGPAGPGTGFLSGASMFTPAASSYGSPGAVVFADLRSRPAPAPVPAERDLTVPIASRSGASRVLPGPGRAPADADVDTGCAECGTSTRSVPGRPGPCPQCARTLCSRCARRFESASREIPCYHQLGVLS